MTDQDMTTPDVTTDPGTDLGVTEPDPAPAPEPTVTEPIGPVRTLTPEEYDLYAAELGALGYVFTAEGYGDEAIGFRVSGNGETYDYRYNEGDTAVDLMDRIVAQLGG